MIEERGTIENAGPLTRYFLAGYLSKTDDESNFPVQQLPTIFDRYETLFTNTLSMLAISKEQLKGRSEFNFDSGDAANLEGGIAILRVVEALRLRGFTEIALVKPQRGKPGADIVCCHAGLRICLEVKSVTKQSTGREGLFLEDQLYEKIREHTEKAAKQLAASAEHLGCDIKILAVVINWFEQSIYLGASDYQQIVNQLEQHGDVESLKGVDGVLFITKMGQQFLFLNETGKKM